MRALLARQIDAKARPRPSSAENRPAIDPSEPILAVSPNFDRATDRRQPNHSTPNSDPKVRHTASLPLSELELDATVSAISYFVAAIIDRLEFTKAGRS